jgi:TonB family protein
VAEKPKSRESKDPRGADRIAGDVDLEDDVTSELAQPFAWAFDDDSLVASLIDPKTDNILEVGTLLNNRFEIVGLAHSGGMGHVYKAIDRRWHSEGSGQIHVAIKMLRESLADRDEVRMILEREAAKAQSLSHPNIINVFDFDEHEDRFFLVMEWLEGESVSALLRRTRGQRIAPNFAWAVIEGAATALHHAHLNNVIHADINPSNIFITTTLDIKLLDFGVARCGNDSDDPAEGGTTWVTQTYASPEVLTGLPPVFQDDVFSLGCVAYRLLGGEHPFGGSPSFIAKDRGVAVEPIPGLPESEWQILSRALAYSRSERPDTVEVFLRNRYPATAIGVSPGKPKWSSAFLHWGLPVAAALVAAAAVGWWLRPDVSVTSSTSGDAQIVPPAEAQDLSQTDAPFIEALLVAARQAVEDQRFVLPEDDNARERYREVLITEPENREALRGLRSISDAFVERARAALKSGDPQAAASALTIASETDASNPAIGVVSDLLVAQGDALLTAARVAAATGDIDQATSALARAEEFVHIEPTAINAVREQLAELGLEIALLDGLAVVDSHIAAGRLLQPVGSNARESLATLSDEYGGDPRLTAAYERLAERLLTRAAFATAAGGVAEAEFLVDAADSLGVLEAEVDFARESITTAAVAADPELESAIADEAFDNPNSTAIDSGTPADADNELELPAAPPQELVTAANEIEPLQSGSGPASGAEVAAAASGGSSAKSLEELGLQRFIAPTFPRRAQRRGLAGYVEVAFDINPDGRTSAIEVLGGENAEIFDKSAADAVRKWRFADRPDTIRRVITLRFEIAE